MATDSNDPAKSSDQEPSSHGGVRKLAAIMFTDIKDFSKKMQKNEAATMRVLDIHNRMMRESIERHHGNVIKTVGDAFLASFESVVGATQCAIEAQQRFHEYNTDKSSDEKITVRVGVHLGDVIIKDNDVFGDGVNIASRIQSMAEPGGVNISGSVYEQVKNKFDIHVINLGVPQLKNIKDMIKVYQVIIVPSDKARGKVSTQIFVAKTILKRKRSQRIAVAVAISIAVMAIVWRYVLAPPPPPANNSIAVLPFENMSDSSNEYFADGLTEDIINHISMIPKLKVISKTSSFFYKHSIASEREIAENLGVRYLVTGTVSVRPENIKISVRLVDPAIEKDIWSSPYEGARSELETMHDQIAAEIARRFRLRIVVISSGSKVSPEVNDLFYRGLYQAKLFTKESNLLAISYFKQILEKDSLFILAKVRLAIAELIMYEKKWDQSEELVNDATLKAKEVLSSDSVSSEAYEILGRVELIKGNQKKGIEFLEKSLNLDQNNVQPLTELGEEYTFNLSDPAKGVTYFSRAVELEPTEFGHVNNLAIGYAMMRNYQKAIEAFRKASRLDPLNESPLSNLGYAFERIGELDSAVYYYQKAIDKNPSNAVLIENICDPLIALNNETHAESLLTKYMKLHNANYRLKYRYAVVLAIQNKKENAEINFLYGTKLMQQILRENPLVPEYHIYAALFFARKNNSIQAKNEALKAFSLDSTNNEVLIGISRVYAVLGEKKEAMKWFARAKSLNPEYDESYLATAIDFEKFRRDLDLLAIARQ